jgi:hypothetical protein
MVPLKKGKNAKQYDKTLARLNAWLDAGAPSEVGF